MSEIRLQVQNLCKSFGITKAVQNVSFNINKGEVHAHTTTARSLF